MIADLFETITAASGSYGCEIWSSPLLSSWDAITSCSLQRYQASVYKRALGPSPGLPSSTSNMLVYFEMGRYPMQIGWLVRTVKYWNKRVADSTNDHNRAVAHLPPRQPAAARSAPWLPGAAEKLLHPVTGVVMCILAWSRVLPAGLNNC